MPVRLRYAHLGNQRVDPGPPPESHERECAGRLHVGLPGDHRTDLCPSGLRLDPAAFQRDGPRHISKIFSAILGRRLQVLELHLDLDAPLLALYCGFAASVREEIGSTKIDLSGATAVLVTDCLRGPRGYGGTANFTVQVSFPLLAAVYRDLLQIGVAKQIHPPPFLSDPAVYERSSDVS